MILEIEELVYGNSCKALLVSTGKLVKIDPIEISQYFIQNFCNSYGPSQSNIDNQIDKKVNV